MKRITLSKIATATFIAAIFATLSTKIAHAEAKVQVGICLLKGKCEYDYSTYVHYFYIYSLRLGLALSGVMIMYSGFIYLTSQGDTTKLNKAKEIFTGAIVGLFLLMSVYAILQFLGL
jgi:hypothetical protein